MGKVKISAGILFRKVPFVCLVLFAFAHVFLISCDALFGAQEVYPTAVHINCEDNDYRVLLGRTKQLSASFTPEDTTDKRVTWSSDNVSVLKCDYATGLLTPVKAGKARITVTSSVDPAITSSELFYVVDSIAEDDIFKYRIVDGTGSSLVVTGTDSKFSGREITIPQVVFFGDDVCTVTGIADQAFENFSSLEKVVVPDSIVSLGKSAFKNCANLNEVVLPETLATIGDRCFEGCDRLFSITVPKSLSSIGEDAFSGCIRLVEVYDLSESLTVSKGSDDNGKIGKHALVIHNSAEEETCLEKADDMAYFKTESDSNWIIIGALSGSATRLSTVNGKCTVINDYAFYGMRYLETVNFGSKDNAIRHISRIGKGAFAECESLKTVKFPQSLSVIDDEAFSGCSSLDEFSVSARVERIGNKAFKDCVSLDIVSIEDFPGSQLIEASEHEPISFGDKVFDGCVDLARLSLTSMGGKTLGQFFSTEPFGSTNERYEVSQSADPDVKYYIPAKLRMMDLTKETEIVDMAFSGCSSLTDMTINEGVTAIGDKAFYECTRIYPKLIVPSSVVRFGEEVFKGIPSTVSIMYDNRDNAANNTVFDIQNGALRIYDMTSAVWRERGMNQLVKSVSFATGSSAAFATSIPARSFEDCKGLTAADLSGLSYLESIGEGAFSGCANLASVSFPQNLVEIGVEAFAFCSALNSASIPSSVSSIGLGAFGGCTGLISISIPFTGGEIVGATPDQTCFGYIFGRDSEKFEISGTTLTNQGTGADAGKQFYIPDSLRTVSVSGVANSLDGTFPNLVFSGCSGLTNIAVNVRNLKVLPSCAFKGCSSLSNISIVANDGAVSNPANTLETIGESAFEGCVALTALASSNILLDSVEHIGPSAFSGCTGLTSVTFPQNMSDIGNEAFAFCSALSSLSVPGGVSSIGLGAFGGCTGLTSMTIPFTGGLVDGATADQTCFGYVFGRDSEKFAISDGTTLTNQALGSEEDMAFYIPDSLRTIAVTGKAGDAPAVMDNLVFRNCAGLTGISLNIENLSGIPSAAFKGCANLESISVVANNGDTSNPVNTLTAIMASAFEDCVNLASVTLPHSITTIGARAFKGCAEMLSIKDGSGFLLLSPISSIGESAFEGCKKLGYVDLWQGWRDTPLTSYVSSIPSKAFFDCVNVNVVIPVSCAAPGSGGSFPIADDAFGVTEESDRAKISVLLPRKSDTNGVYDFFDGSNFDFINIPSWVSASGCRPYRYIGVITDEEASRWYYSSSEISAVSGKDPTVQNPAP